jgi:hypothetical protein
VGELHPEQSLELSVVPSTGSLHHQPVVAKKTLHRVPPPL